ncbi:PIN-like domain-containing protein [Nocardiopsis dassonvillei]|uniref:PIN-like domain-containing protein n=1 Tax=Nocardiopsis dassonvillei TaxID=2014 RepID=UPI003672CD7A
MNKPSATGMFDGFEEYATTTDDQIKDALQTGIIALDANVLLNLYRYNSETRKDLLLVLDNIKNRLWIPHQVMLEFWRNRDSALSGPAMVSTETEKLLGGYRDKSRKAIESWIGRCFFTSGHLAEEIERLEYAFDSIVDEIRAVAQTEWEQTSRDTNKDAVIASLKPILEGSIGNPFNESDLIKKRTEGKERLDNRIPPGYMDEGKADDKALGDFFVWEQILHKAAEGTPTVLFVTGDTKEDWWRREGPTLRGPREELVREMLDRTGSMLFMIQPPSLLKFGAEILDLDIDEESVKEVERVDRALEGGTTDGGWTRTGLHRLFEEMFTEGRGDRYDVIAAAAENGGFIERGDVYDICDFNETRQLKGFTRPINRIAQSLEAEGLIPHNAVKILETVYEPGSVQAAGFQINPEVLPLVIDVIGEDES